MEEEEEEVTGCARHNHQSLLDQTQKKTEHGPDHPRGTRKRRMTLEQNVIG